MNHCASIIFKSITSESIFFLASFSTGANIGSEKISNNNKKHTHTGVDWWGVAMQQVWSVAYGEHVLAWFLTNSTIIYIYIYMVSTELYTTARTLNTPSKIKTHSQAN